MLGLRVGGDRSESVVITVAVVGQFEKYRARSASKCEAFITCLRCVLVN